MTAEDAYWHACAGVPVLKPSTLAERHRQAWQDFQAATAEMDHRLQFSLALAEQEWGPL